MLSVLQFHSSLSPEDSTRGSIIGLLRRHLNLFNICCHILCLYLYSFYITFIITLCCYYLLFCISFEDIRIRNCPIPLPCKMKFSLNEFSLKYILPPPLLKISGYASDHLMYIRRKQMESNGREGHDTIILVCSTDI